MKKIVPIIITALIILVFTKVDFGQTPDLGKASSFVLFTCTGEFKSTGASNVTGDIGTNLGALSGFPPGIILGETHVEDSISSLVKIDVEAAYDVLKLITCDSVIGIRLGNDQVLTPKVYCIGDSVNLNGNLFLDGLGDPNALFIIKVDSGFSSNPLSSITLINDASLKNVYWCINGNVTIGDSTVFRGNILANGAITFLEGASFEGRALSINGDILLNNNIIDIVVGPLPIELISFVAFPVNQNVKIDWSTASETNNDYFTVQRTIDGNNFENIMMIKGAENSNILIHYTATDQNPLNGTSYYRLKQTDFDGKFSYSDLKAVNVEKTSDFKIYPNPFRDYTTITLNESKSLENVQLIIYDILGKVVMKTILNKQTTSLETNIFPSGIYYYQISGNNKLLQSGKLISQQ